MRNYVLTISPINGNPVLKSIEQPFEECFNEAIKLMKKLRDPLSKEQMDIEQHYHDPMDCVVVKTEKYKIEIQATTK